LIVCVCVCCYHLMVNKDVYKRSSPAAIGYTHNSITAAADAKGRWENLEVGPWASGCRRPH